MYTHTQTHTHIVYYRLPSRCVFFSFFPFLSLSLSLSLSSPSLFLSIVERLSRNVVHALHRRFVVNVARLSARCSSRASLVGSSNPINSSRSCSSIVGIGRRSNRESVSRFRSVTRAQTGGQLFVTAYQQVSFIISFPSPPSILFRPYRNRFS